MWPFDLPGFMTKVVNVALFLAIQLLGVLGFLAGEQVRLTTFFLIPIMLITWRMGGLAGYIATANALAILTFDSIIDKADDTNLLFLSIDIVGRFASFFIIVFILSKLHESHAQLSATVIRDSLTHLYNRLGFREIVDVEIRKSRRDLHPFALIFLDCDNFKSVNDQWGHHVGDQLLCSVSQGLTESVRRSDVVCRLGGDEFVIFAADIEEKELGSFVQKIKEHLDAIMRANRWPVTFSIGVAFFESVPESMDEVIRFADSLMYEAKKTGKNEVRLATWQNPGSPV